MRAAVAVLALALLLLVAPGALASESVVEVGRDVVVAGQVDRVVVVGGDVELRPTARVRDDVIVLFGDLRSEPGATIGGSRYVVSRGLIDWIPGPTWVELVLLALALLAYRALVWVAVCAIAGAALRAAVFERWSGGWEDRPARALSAGVVASALVLPALALIAATGLGLPLALMGLAALLVAAGAGLAMLREGPLWPRRPSRAAYAAYLLVPPALEIGLLTATAVGLGAALRAVGAAARRDRPDAA